MKAVATTAHCVRDGYMSAIGRVWHDVQSRWSVEITAKYLAVAKKAAIRRHVTFTWCLCCLHCLAASGWSISTSRQGQAGRFKGEGHFFFFRCRGVRHAVALSTLNIRHSVEFSSSAVSVARELRYCVCRHCDRSHRHQSYPPSIWPTGSFGINALTCLIHYKYPESRVN